MGYFANRRARKEARRAQEARINRALRESYNHPVYGLDPASTALLVTTMGHTNEVDHDEDVDDNADDTGREESAVDTQESYSYESPAYTDPAPSSDYNSFDSGSSYSSSYDSGSSSYDSGSSFSSDSGSY